MESPSQEISSDMDFSYSDNSLESSTEKGQELTNTEREGMKQFPSNVAKAKERKRKKDRSSKSLGSVEEICWQESTEKNEISEEGRRTWEVGKKLGLIGKVSDEEIIKKMELMEKRDREMRKRGSSKAVKGDNTILK